MQIGSGVDAPGVDAPWRLGCGLHVGTRRVLAAACAAEPNSAWVTQQARNLSWQVEDEGLKLGRFP